MVFYDQTLAAEAIERLALGEQNDRFARYWLSLWKDGVPPERRAVNPAKLKDHLPGLVIAEFHHDGRLICRLAGSAVAMAVGFDPTGKDIIALSPEKFRAFRLERHRAVAAGAISRCIRPLENRFNQAVMVEDILLPMSDVADGVTVILYHAAWRPQTMDRSQPEIVNGGDVPAHETISIAHPEPLRAAS